MRSPPAIGDRRPGRDAGSGEPLHHLAKHCRLAAMPMIGAGRIDDDAIRRIGGDDRRIAAKRPQRQPLEGLDICFGLGVMNDQARNQGLRLARRHADPQAGTVRCRIDGEHDTATPITADKNERRLRQRRGVARFPSESGLSATSEGRATRPLASHASTVKSALSPARHRISSRCQRARPIP